MDPLRTNNLKQCARAVGLLALAGVISGCQTTYRMADQRFMAHPAEHRRVQVLPVWFEGTAKTDRTLSTNDLARLCFQTGTDLCTALQQTLESKGYQVVGKPGILPASGEGLLPDPSVSNDFAVVRKDFSEALLRHYFVAAGTPLRFWTNRTHRSYCPGETNDSARILTEHNPFHYQLTPVFTNVLRQLGATNAEAVLLLDTKAVFQSPHQHVKANRWNYTAGALIAVTEVAANLAALAGSAMGGPVYQPFWIDPFWRPRNSIRHTFAFVDAGSGEVLWFNRQTFEYKDPRAPEILSETVKATLCDLPLHVPEFPQSKFKIRKSKIQMVPGTSRPAENRAQIF